MASGSESQQQSSRSLPSEAAHRYSHLSGCLWIVAKYVQVGYLGSASALMFNIFYFCQILKGIFGISLSRENEEKKIPGEICLGRVSSAR